MSSIEDPSPGNSSDLCQRLRLIDDFWQQLFIGGDPGETTWEELESLYRQVQAALRQVPMNVTRAETLTAYAALLMTGRYDF